MTYPRAHLVDPAGGTYNVGARCVRRAFLCGKDPLSGRDFSHRRTWVEERVLMLADVFAVDLFGYSIMTNHYHITLTLVPDRVDSWSDEDIANKWLTLHPGTRKSREKKSREQRLAELLADSKKLLTVRERLGSLSWFMRCLNENIARRANEEDGCKGKFWEARFHSQRVLDDNSMLASLVYTDLNPIRAGIAAQLEECRYTSLYKRMSEQSDLTPMSALNAPYTPLAGNYTLRDYKDLTAHTALAQQSVRSISAAAARNLAWARAEKADVSKATLALQPYLPASGRWQRALGSPQALRDYAASIGQRWIKTYSAPP